MAKKAFKKYNKLALAEIEFNTLSVAEYPTVRHTSSDLKQTHVFQCAHKSSPPSSVHKSTDIGWVCLVEYTRSW